MSGRGKPRHEICSRRAWAALLVLGTLACSSQRPGAPAATTPSAATPAASAAATEPPEPSKLRPASLRLLGELRSPVWLDLYVSRDIQRLAAAAQDVERLLRDYERAGNGRVKLAVHEVGKDISADAVREAGLVQIPE